jgi:hypothetical protein
MSKVIKERMDRSMVQDGESFWVLQEPGTDNTIMSFKDGEAVGPITFRTEDDAITFANKYNVSNKMVPTYHTMRLKKDN